MEKRNRHYKAHSKWSQNSIVRAGIVIVAFISVYAVSMYVPLIGGFTSYPVAIIKCGKLPIVTSNFMGVYDYSQPGTSNYKGATIFSTMKNYVCTAQDAQEQGYHKAAL